MTKIKYFRIKKQNRYFKNEIIGVIFMTVLFSCGNNTSNKKNIEQTEIESSQSNIDEQIATIENDITEIKKTKSTKFYIKDETKYSENFLSEFKKYHGCYETVSLIEDTIIVNNDKENLIIIPTDLPLNKKIIYEKIEKEKEKVLIVKRVNFSTLEYYHYEIVKGKKINEKQGRADLEPTFYFGAEGTFEDEDENIYGMNEYIDYSEKTCWTYIYVGVGSIEKSFLIYGCEVDGKKFSTSELVKRK